MRPLGLQAARDCRVAAAPVTVLPSFPRRSSRQGWLQQWRRLARFLGFTPALGRPLAVRLHWRAASEDPMRWAFAFALVPPTIRAALVRSSQSQVVVERFRRTLFAQVRTIRVAVASRLDLVQEEIQVDSPVFPWIVKHSVWLLNRFLTHATGPAPSMGVMARGHFHELQTSGWRSTRRAASISFRRRILHSTVVFGPGKIPIRESTS